jgi:glycosyltransferase involved in cell wall biosynthesis
MDSPDFVRKCEFPATVYGLGAGLGTYGYSPRAVPWLKENLASYNIVIVNCIWQYNTLAAYRALNGSGVPYAVVIHGMLDPYFKNRFPLKHIKKTIYWHLILRRILHEASAVLFTCEEERILARQSFPGYRVQEAVIPYGTFGPDCDPETSSEEFLSRWPHLRGKRLAITLGRIHPKKGTDILIKAFAETLSKDPAWHLVIAGPDQVGWQAQLESLAAGLQIAGQITWTGMLKGPLKWGAFTSADVFALPSHQENFGIVVAEAMACSLPVILSSKVNIWREIETYQAGLVCDDTLDGTKAALIRWSQLTPAEVKAICDRSKQCFDDLFNFTATSKKLLDTIERVARSKPMTASSIDRQSNDRKAGY